MDLLHAIVIAGPFSLPMTRRVGGPLDSIIAVPFVRITSSFLLRVPMHVLLQRPYTSLTMHAHATLPTATHRPDDGRAIISFGPLTAPFVGAPPQRI
jgi:hypothetical protein